MSTGPNHRRGHGRIQLTGPTWEGPTPSGGCNGSHVAQARRKYQNAIRRAERRTGRTPKWAHMIGRARELDNPRELERDDEQGT